RLDVDGLPASDFFLFALGQVQGQRPGDLSDDGILNPEDIRDAAVVAIRPDLPAGDGIDQLSVDPHGVSGATHAALNHIAHSQVLGHLAHFNPPALVGEARIAGDDEQAGYL